MIRKLLVAVIVLSCLAACGSKKTAFDYSQNIVKKEKSLMNDITTTEMNIRGFMSAEQYDSIAAAAERMEKLIDAKLTEIKNDPLPDVKEAAVFKEASIRYFGFIKSLYTGYKEYGKATTLEQRNEASEKQRDLINKKKEAINNMQSAQQKFAEANGFKLENK